MKGILKEESLKTHLSKEEGILRPPAGAGRTPLCEGALRRGGGGCLPLSPGAQKKSGASHPALYAHFLLRPGNLPGAVQDGQPPLNVDQFAPALCLLPSRPAPGDGENGNSACVTRLRSRVIEPSLCVESRLFVRGNSLLPHPPEYRAIRFAISRAFREAR